MPKEEDRKEKERDPKKMAALQRRKFVWGPDDIEIISGPKKGKDSAADSDEEQDAEGRGGK